MRKKRIFRFRYKLSIYAMILGIMIAYICFAYGGQLARKLQLEEKDAQAARTSGEILEVYLVYEDEGENILPQFAEEGISGYIDSVHLYSDRDEVEVLTSVFLSTPEMFPYEVVEGIVPTHEILQGAEPVIVLGKGLKNRTYHKGENNYYKICGQEYRVIGYVSAENADGLDYVRCLFYDNLEDKVKEEIDFRAAREGLRLIFKSDAKNLIDFYKERSTQLSSHVRSIDFTMDAQEHIYIEDGALRDYYQYAYLLYLFAVVLVIMVTQLWIVQRKREFAIRRAVGFTKGQIILLIAGELLKIIVVVGILLVGMQMLLQNLLGIGDSTQFDVTGIRTALLFMIATFLLLMIYPVMKITQGSVAEAIQSSGRYAGEG